MNMLGFVWYIWAHIGDWVDSFTWTKQYYEGYQNLFRPFQQWVEDYEGLSSALSSIGTGIGSIFYNLPPLFSYIACISFSLLLMSLVIRIIIDFL